MGDRPSSTEDLAAAIRGLTQAISQLSVQAPDEGWELVASPHPRTPRDQQELDSDAAGDPERVVGPHQVFSVAALAEQDDGGLSPTGGLVSVLVVDFRVESQGFAPEGGIFPDYPALLAEVRAWVQDEMGGPAERLAFYSAVEEEVVQAPPLGGKAKAKAKAKQAAPKKLSNAHLQNQLDLLTTLLPKSEPAAAAEEPAEMDAAGVGHLNPEEAELLQPPGQSSVTAAMLEQSRALSQLVSHLVSADGLSDAAALGSTPGLGLGMRGAAKRERLQQELASRSGVFLLQVAQQACRRLAPTQQVPQTIHEICQAHPALFTTYVERTGGYGSQRDSGLMMWILANLSNALLAEDVKAASDIAALAMVALEQSVMDGGRWDVAYLLSLMEDPPAAIFAHRPPSQNPRLRAFSALCPQGWATTAMTYVKEVDSLATRRAEAAGAPAKPKAQEAEQPQPKGGKRRFPRKPKDPPVSDRRACRACPTCLGGALL